MQPQPAEGKTPPNVLSFGRARESIAPIPDQAVSEPGPEIHDHVLIRRIGRGAYGEVWLARNALGTCRAIKIVYRKDFDDSRPFEREFAGIQKFEPISRSHPGLVNILQVGRREDYFYYVMELADAAEEPKSEARNPKSEPVAASDKARNSACPLPSPLAPRASDLYRPRTLREDLRQNGRLPAERCVEIGLALTSALAHLHRHGLVHRDVKPSNIIFVQGAPKLADIGLVTEAGDSRSIVGTEGYLPPEGPGTPQADIFSLGKVLYEISTGQDRHRFPDLPRELKDWPDRAAVLELNELFLKACAAGAAERYHSAGELTGELCGLQRGRSVKRQRIWRQRLVLVQKVVPVALAVLVAGAGGFFLWQMRDRHTIVSFDAGEAAGTSNPRAAQAYRLGLPPLRRGTPEGFREALQSFTTAIQADPKFVSAYERLFEVYLISEDHGLRFIDGKAEKLNELAGKLEKIAPTNAQTHAARAIVHFVNDWNWTAAEQQFKQALTIDPGCRLALTYYGYFLTRLGRPAEAEPILKRALELAPDSPVITKFLGHCKFVEHKYDEAGGLYQQAFRLEPSYPSAHYWAWRVCVVRTNFAQAIDEWEEYALKEGFDPLWVREWSRRLGEALNSAGPRGYWLKLIEMTDEDDLKTSYRYAELYAHLGDRKKALDRLDRAVAEHGAVENLLADEFWDDFHRESKFKEVLNKVGLAKWAR